MPEIEKIFDIRGRINKHMVPFKKNVNYNAFLVVRKDLILEEPNETYMTSSTKNNEEKKRVYNDRTIDGPELVNIHTDPAVLKKSEAARKAYEECNIREWLLKRNNLI